MAVREYCEESCPKTTTGFRIVLALENTGSVFREFAGQIAADGSDRYMCRAAWAFFVLLWAFCAMACET